MGPVIVVWSGSDDKGKELRKQVKASISALPPAGERDGEATQQRWTVDIRVDNILLFGQVPYLFSASGSKKNPFSNPLNPAALVHHCVAPPLSFVFRRGRESFPALIQAPKKGKATVSFPRLFFFSLTHFVSRGGSEQEEEKLPAAARQ